jgi:hypothetical protein
MSFYREKERRTVPKVSAPWSGQAQLKDINMFTQLNTRIGKALICVIIPFSMTIGLAQSAVQADQSQGKRTYSVRMNGTTIAVRIDRVQGNTVNGAILFDEQECLFGANWDGTSLQGSIDYGGHEIPFTATLKGDVLYLDMMGTHLALVQEN